MQRKLSGSGTTGDEPEQIKNTSAGDGEIATNYWYLFNVELYYIKNKCLYPYQAHYN